jgi:DNA-binding NtrC family response regulator
MALLSQSAAQEEMNTSKRMVLIVEDDPDNAATLELLLQLEDHYQTLYFRNAEEVLANLDIIQASYPALFILDFLLPKLSGLDLYDQLHATRGLEHVPVIIVTGSLLTDKQRVRLAQPGFVTINKPYDVDDMLDTIRQLTS